MATICCSRPTTPPSYTICFPDQQVIPDNTTQVNPYYDFVAQQSVWTYTIHIDPGGSDIKDLSHWVFQMCPALAAAARNNVSNYFKVEVSENGGAFIDITNNVEVFDSTMAEPTTGLFNVLKINRGQPKDSTFTYRITIINPSFFDLAAEPGGNIVINAGGNNFTFNTCNPPLPTPSYNCNRVPKPQLNLTKTCPVPQTGNSFNVGDTVTINLAVTNSSPTAAATNVTVVDLLNIPAGVRISSLTTSPTATVSPSQPDYTGNININTTWTGLTINPNSTLPLTITFTILDAPFDTTDITNLDAGIGQLSGTSAYRCTIPVSNNKLTLIKTCPVPQTGNSFNVGDTVTIDLAVTNPSLLNPATNVTVVDLLNIPAGVTISSITTSPTATVSPLQPSYTGDINITTTWTGLTINPNSTLPLTITFTILDAPTTITNITNVDAGIGQLSGTSYYRCTIPVVKPPTPPTRGIEFNDLKFFI